MRHNNVGSINAAVVSCNNVNLCYICQLTAYKYVRLTMVHSVSALLVRITACVCQYSVKIRSVLPSLES